MIKFLPEDEANRRLLFVDNLKYIIRTKKLNANKLALRMGVNPSTICDYTKGRIFPNDERIYQLAAALECSVDDLFDDSYLPWVFGPEGITDKEKYKDLL
jgi:transcriptional regulator with XRE-family HTH domain